MSGIKETVQDAKNTFFSGGPGTTGREVFEDSTATGPGTTRAGASGQAPADNEINSGLGGVGSGLQGSAGLSGAGMSGDGIHRPHDSTANTAAGTALGQNDNSTGHGVGHSLGGHGHHSHHDNSHIAHGNGVDQVTTGATGLSTGAAAGHHSHHSGHHERALHHEGASSGVDQATAGVAGLSTGAAAGHHSHHSGHHERAHHHEGASGVGATGVGATGTTTGTTQDSALGSRGSDVPTGSGPGTSNQPTDLTGNLQQSSHLYERTGVDGPLTSGAANTSKFDTDKPSTASSTVQGDTTASGHRVPEGEAGSGEKKSGGLMGVFATSDKDFTSNRDRIGSGAYADTHGHFKLNESGPGGNTALTGREGTFENNPVAQAKSREGASDVAPAGTEEPHKKSLMEKVKDALS